MATSNTISSVGALVKEYVMKQMPDLSGDKYTTLNLLPKDPKAGGEGSIRQSLLTHGITGSADFSTASTNANAIGNEAFLVPRVKDYSICRVDGEVLAAGQGEQALINMATLQADQAIQAQKRRRSIHLFGNRTGELASINGVVTGATVQLAAPFSDAKRFQKGDVIVAASSSTAALRSGGAAKATVVSSNSRLGQVTFSAALNTLITDVADGDSLFMQGDAYANDSYKVLGGLEVWLTDGTADTLFSVTRPAGDNALHGQYVDGTSARIDEALIELCMLVSSAQGTPSHIVVSPEQRANLSKVLGSARRYTDVKVGKFGFKALALDTDDGEVPVISDPFCPSNVAYALQMDTWSLASAREHIRVLDDDGLTIRAASDADAYDIRVGGYFGLVCSAPAWNGKVAL